MTQLSRPEVAALVSRAGGDPNVLTVVGIRGALGQNRRGVYDDEIYLISPNIFLGFKGNTDPSRVRVGSGTGANKGMAVLEPGLYHAHGLGLHRGKYTALVQIKGDVTVRRDGSPPYLDVGRFGINIHNGGWNSTSSLGCQTLHPSEWPRFIAAVQAEMRQLRQSVAPYLLVDRTGSRSAGLPVRRTGTVNLGSEGDRVRELQTSLNKWASTVSPAPDWAPLKVDGDFGEKTERALKAFQAANGLEDDGVAGRLTWAKLPAVA